MSFKTAQFLICSIEMDLIKPGDLSIEYLFLLSSCLCLMFLLFVSAYQQHLVWLLGGWLWYIWLQPLHWRIRYSRNQTCGCCWEAWFTGSDSLCVTRWAQADSHHQLKPPAPSSFITSCFLSNLFNPLLLSTGCPTRSGTGAAGGADAQNDGHVTGWLHPAGSQFKFIYK